MPAAHFVLFLAVVAQVLLIFVLAVRLGMVRHSARKTDEVDLDRAAVDHAAWPRKALQAANAYANQFEMPVLFFVAVIFTFVIGGAGWFMAILAWLYVVFRVIHAVIHIGSNIVMRRFAFFMLSNIVLLVMWGYLLGHAFGSYLAVA